MKLALEILGTLVLFGGLVFLLAWLQYRLDRAPEATWGIGRRGKRGDGV